MKNSFFCSIALIMAGCAPQAVDEAATEDQTNESADTEVVESRPIDGRWGITEMACSRDNDTGDGVILISRYDVMVGLDACSIAGISEMSGVYEINGMCEGMEGSYEQTFYFSTPEPGVLRWDNRDFDRVENYVLCAD